MAIKPTHTSSRTTSDLEGHRVRFSILGHAFLFFVFSLLFFFCCFSFVSYFLFGLHSFLVFAVKVRE